MDTNTADMIDAREAFRAWLTERGLSLRGAGAVIGCSGNMVHMLLRGQRQPGRKLAVRLAREAGIPVEAWDHG